MKITANVVTIARIFLLPIPCALLLYDDGTAMGIAFVLFVLLGATDFVDGMMARREGPTRLGGLLDPVADKMFVAAIVLTLGALHLIPWWAPSAILSREFLLTILRSSVALRKEHVKTSVLGKIKTVIQMGGFGTIFLTLSLPKAWVLIVSTILCLSLLAVSAYWSKTRRKWPPFWMLPVAGSFLFWFFLTLLFEPQFSVLLQTIAIVAITWVSAIDYLATTYRIFWRTGLHDYDVVRIFWALAHSIGAISVVSFFPNTVLPILISISLELALGGVDNVVAADKSYAGKKPFLATGVLATLLAICAYGNVLEIWSVNLIILSSLLAFGSLAAFAATYRKWSHLFARVLD